MLLSHDYALKHPRHLEGLNAIRELIARHEDASPKLLEYYRLYSIEYVWALDYVVNHLPAGKRILDIGGSRSSVDVYLATLGYHVRSLDRKVSGAGEAESSIAAASEGSLARSQGDALDPSVPPSHFRVHCALSLSAIEHNCKSSIMRIVRRVLQALPPGGDFLLTYPMQLREAWHPHGSYHKRATQVLMFDPGTEADVCAEAQSVANVVVGPSAVRSYEEEWAREQRLFAALHPIHALPPYLSGGLILQRRPEGKERKP